MAATAAKSRGGTVRAAASLAAACAAALAAALAPATLLAGSIRATLDAKEPVKRAWAIERSPQTIKDSKGKEFDVGLYGQPVEGKVDGNRVVIENLRVPGRYDLQFETASGGTVAGWDATVPESDYVDDLPLAEDARQAIFRKQASKQFSAFADLMWVLDVQGNIQHAALLVMQLRMQPFVGGAYKPGEWVWRVERWHWEDPDEHTWVPYQERPFYALVRERLYEKDYRAKRVAYARHLGGIALTAEKPDADLGPVKVPAPAPGVCAVDPKGERIPPVVLKGPAGADTSGQSGPATQGGGPSEGGKS